MGWCGFCGGNGGFKAGKFGFWKREGGGGRAAAAKERKKLKESGEEKGIKGESRRLSSAPPHPPPVHVGAPRARAPIVPAPGTRRDVTMPPGRF